MTLDLIHVLDTMSTRRPLFQSTDELQATLARTVRLLIPQSTVQFNLPIHGSPSPTRKRHLDLFIKTNGQSHAVELLYRTREAQLTAGGKHYNLKSHAAQPLGRYDFLRKLAHIEQLPTVNPSWTGWVILLTNDSAYWKPPARPRVIYEQFSLEDGRQVSGQLAWAPTAAAGTITGREAPIKLRGQYHVTWRDYADFSTQGYSQFRYLCLKANLDSIR